MTELLDNPVLVMHDGRPGNVLPRALPNPEADRANGVGVNAGEAGT